MQDLNMSHGDVGFVTLYVVIIPWQPEAGSRWQQRSIVLSHWDPKICEWKQMF